MKLSEEMDIHVSFRLDFKQISISFTPKHYVCWSLEVVGSIYIEIETTARGQSSV